MSEMRSPPESLHINCPEQLSRQKRLGDALVTGIMWGIYTYLWAPLLSLVAWLLGFEFAYDVMVRAGGLAALRSVLLWYGTMLVAIVITVSGWSLINRMRFAHKDRRKGMAPADDEDIREFFELDVGQLEKLRNLRSVRLSHDDTGRIVMSGDESEATAAGADGISDRSAQIPKEVAHR